MKFYEAIKNRRSIYNINNEKIVSEEKISEIVEFYVKNTPTPYNSFGNRVLILFDQAHIKIWNQIKFSLKEQIGEENFKPNTENKLNSFAAGYCTILFFEDNNLILDLQENFPTYKNDFPSWFLQASGMLQNNIWTALQTENLGCSLQHYNIFLTDFLIKEFNIPTNWNLLSQMPIGKKVSDADIKDFSNCKDDSIKIFR